MLWAHIRAPYITRNRTVIERNIYASTRFDGNQTNDVDSIKGRFAF